MGQVPNCNTFLSGDCDLVPHATQSAAACILCEPIASGYEVLATEHGFLIQQLELAYKLAIMLSEATEEERQARADGAFHARLGAHVCIYPRFRQC